MPLLPIPSHRGERLAVLNGLQAGEIDAETAARRLLDLDPDYGPAYLIMGNARGDADDLAGAEAWLWQGLERQPCEYNFYLALSDILRRSASEGPVSERLGVLGIWKVGLSSSVSDGVADMFRSSLETDWDLNVPETYESVASALESQMRENGEAPEVRERLLPYELLNDLQRQSREAVEPELVRRILANSERCIPLWRSALREWAHDLDSVALRAVDLVIALLGEMAGVEILDDFLELANSEEQEIFLHVHWAMYRLGQRFPAEVLARLRAAIPQASVPIRCALAEQINLLPAVDGLVPALRELVADFAAFAADPDAPYLLMLTADALDELRETTERQEVFDRCRSLLPPAGLATLRKLTERLGGFRPDLVSLKIDGMTIDDICIERVLMLEAEEESPAVKPERNDPCWCGSGKKYKKCHLAADEERARQSKPS